jgi:hypothetical protein
VGAKLGRLLLVAALGAAAGCHKKPTEGGVGIDQASDAISSAGIKTDGLRPADAAQYGASRCVAGSLEGIDTLLCEYSVPEAVTAGKKAAEKWTGESTTAAVLNNGRALLAVADRSHVDPNGKAIHKITHAFKSVH